jgi:hypothetical protein
MEIIWYNRVRNEVELIRDKEETNINNIIKRPRPIGLVASAVETAVYNKLLKEKLNCWVEEVNDVSSY